MAAEAYSVLGDPERRSLYDRYGEAGLKSGPAGGFDVDMFSDFADILGGFFGFNVGFGESPGGAQQRRRGATLQYQLEIDLELAARGDQVSLKVPRRASCTTCDGKGAAEGAEWISCPQCGGSGQIHSSQGFLTIARPCRRCGGEGNMLEKPCVACGGSGQLGEEAEIDVAIPAGVDTGMRLVVRGAGDRGVRGGPPGDLEVVLRVREHSRFMRRDKNLYTRVPISFPKAALGGEVSAPTLNGEPVSLSVPAGAQSGDVLEIPGAGMPGVNGGRLGSLHVALQVMTPKKLTDDQRRLIEDLADLTPEPPPTDEGRSWWDRLRGVFE